MDITRKSYLMPFRFLIILLLFPCMVGAQEIFQPERIQGVPDNALFVDLRLKIESANCPSWTQCRVRVAGTHNGQEVGLEIQVKIANATSNSFKISYISVGEASNRLLSAMAQLYRLPLANPQFNKNVVADLVPLQATKNRLDAKAFFFADGPESRYAELYTNIDLQQSLVWIKEKDDSYRGNVVRAFTQ